MELCTKTLKFNRKLLTEGTLNKAMSQAPTDSQDGYASSEPDHEFICKQIHEYFSARLLNHLEEILNFRKKALLEAESSNSEYDSAYEDDPDEYLEEAEQIATER
jgi:hypothetical protein